MIETKKIAKIIAESIGEDFEKLYIDRNDYLKNRGNPDKPSDIYQVDLIYAAIDIINFFKENLKDFLEIIED